jgi:hypothetical protein
MTAVVVMSARGELESSCTFSTMNHLQPIHRQVTVPLGRINE